MQRVFVPGSAADGQWSAAVYRNRRIAAQIFGALFTVACVGQLVFLVSTNWSGSAGILPFVLPILTVLLTGLEWWHAGELGEPRATESAPRKGLPAPSIWVISLFECLLPILGVWFLGNIVGWETALGGPPMIAAVVIPFVSVLRLDYRICVLQGAIGAVAVTSLVMWSSQSGPGAHELTSTEWVWNFGKGVLLFGSGVIAGLIAHQNRRRLQEVIQEHQRGDALQDSLRERDADYQRVADALLGKNELISILSHDLRAPLDGVSSLAQLMARAPDKFTADDVRKYAAEIHDTTRNLRELLDNLVVWAELKAGRSMPTLQAVSLQRVGRAVSGLFEPALTARDLTLVTEFPSGEVMGWGDESAVSTVVRNLVSNAVKFTPPGGRITLGVDSSDLPQRVGLIVTDSGIGMPQKQDLEPEPAETPRPHSGLGLALCRQLLGQMEGSLEFQPGAKGGTEARVWLQHPSQVESGS